MFATATALVDLTMCKFYTQGFRLKRSAWQDRRIHLAKFASARSGLTRGHGHGAAAARLPKTVAMAPPRAIYSCCLCQRGHWILRASSTSLPASECTGAQCSGTCPHSQSRQLYYSLSQSLKHMDIIFTSLGGPRSCLFAGLDPNRGTRLRNYHSGYWWPHRLDWYIGSP